MKIQVGRQATGKKFPHNLSRNYSSTSSVGFCEPCLCRELAAQDTVNLRIGQIVRLNPMVKPTFGNIKLKTYTSFIPSADIYHAYESFLSHRSYHGAGESYIPSSVPSIRFSHLNALCCYNAKIYMYQLPHAGISDEMAYFDFTDETPTQVKRSSLTDAQYNAVRKKFFAHFGITELTDADLLTLLQNRNTAQRRYLGLSADQLDPFDQEDFALTAESQSYFDELIYDDSLGWEGGPVLFAIKFNFIGLNLRKIFIGLGYKLNFDSTYVELLRLFGYYKSYFDLFYPKRDMTWKNTAAFSIMETCEQTGDNLPFDNWHNSFVGDQRCWDFFMDLAFAYYTINPDYASAHIVGVSTQDDTAVFNYLDSEGQSNVVGSPDENTLPDLSTYDNTVDRTALRVLNELTKLYNSSTAIGGEIGDFLRTEFNSEYIDEHKSYFLGSQILDLNPQPVFSTNESDTVSLGEFAGQCIGSTSGSGDIIHFTAKAPGYLFTFYCLVPDARLAQGVDPCIYHRERFDFFDARFDAITLLPSRKANIYGSCEIDVDEAHQYYERGFGNMPNYSEYAVSQNIVNGEMSLRGKRASYMPFTLDKLLPYGRDVVYTIPQLGVDHKVWYFGGFPAAEITAGLKWRYIGMLPWFGYFDRIFYNSGNQMDSYNNMSSIRPDDNYIIQMYQDLRITGYKLPLGQSFDTDVDKQDYISVEKS